MLLLTTSIVNMFLGIYTLTDALDEIKSFWYGFVYIRQYPIGCCDIGGGPMYMISRNLLHNEIGTMNLLTGRHLPSSG